MAPYGSALVCAMFLTKDLKPRHGSHSSLSIRDHGGADVKVSLARHCIM